MLSWDGNSLPLLTRIPLTLARLAASIQSDRGDCAPMIPRRGFGARHNNLGPGMGDLPRGQR
jgi:hypothetical protein